MSTTVKEAVPGTLPIPCGSEYLDTLLCGAVGVLNFLVNSREGACARAQADVNEYEVCGVCHFFCALLEVRWGRPNIPYPQKILFQ